MNKIPSEVKNQVDNIVDEFNKQVIKDEGYYYITRYRGKYLYLDPEGFMGVSPICRLEYHGEIDDWDFAIYKYSNEKYDPTEWMFPGMEEVDGTIEGALRAGLEAYP